MQIEQLARGGESSRASRSCVAQLRRVANALLVRAAESPWASWAIASNARDQDYLAK
jgi:hypothetical protein